MILTHALDSFILEQRLRGNADKTIRGYLWILNMFISWLKQHEVTTIDELTLHHVQRYQLYINDRPADGRRQGKLKKRTVQTYMRHIKAFLTFCHSEGFPSEPIKLKLPKAERPVIEILTSDEIDVILDAFSKSELGLRNRALICILLDCGLRIDEAITLETANINFENGYLKVEGKGRKERIVPVELKTRRAMIAYIHKRRAADDPDDDKYFFLTKQRMPLTYGSAKALMKTLKKRTGIIRLYAHLFRHTFATNFLVHGIGDVYELSRILGHSNIQTTELYLQLASYYTIIQKRKRKTYLDSI